MCVHQVDVTSIDEAMAILYPRHKVWEDNPNDWIFRGHGDGQWQLLPSAFRDNALLYDPTSKRIDEGRQNKIFSQIDSEWRTLQIFLAQTDQAGLPFARSDDSFFDYGVFLDKWEPLFNRIKRGEIHEWPPPELAANLGLAQHYGIHTRLLDFTTQLSVAAYFAAAKAASLHFSKSPPAGFKEFTIWGLRISALDFFASIRKAVAKVIRVPRANNPNLHAQSGVFVNYWPYGTATKPDDPFAPETLDKALCDAFRTAQSTHPTNVVTYSPLLVRVNIPERWAPEVLRMLAEQGASPAAYFPGYQGAAMAALERRYWR